MEVSGCAPPIPSICLSSGLPMIRSSRSSRSPGSAGRSDARKYAPFDVPPRISMHRTPPSPGHPDPINLSLTTSHTPTAPESVNVAT